MHAFRIVKEGDHQYMLHYTDGSGAAQSVGCGLVMMATGRKPRVDGIGLEVRSQAAIQCSLACTYRS